MDPLTDLRTHENIQGMSRSPDSQSAAVEAVLALINGWSWGEKRQILEARQDVFAGAETDRAFRDLARQYEGHPERLQLIETHHAIVREAREHGIDRAFAPYATAPPIADVDAELASRLAVIASELGFLTMFSREPHLRRRLMEIVGEYLNAPTNAGKRAALEQHASILLTPGAEWFFGSEALAGHPAVGVHLELLRAVREHGVSAAFDTLGPEDPTAYVVSALHMFDTLSSPTDAAERIDTARNALSVLPQSGLPASVGVLLRTELARSLCELQAGDRAKHIEEAITILREALADAEALESPRAPGVVHEVLGMAYLARLSPDRANDVRLAREHYERALALHDARGDPVGWARLALNVAQASASTRAVELLTGGLKVFKREEFPREWAVTQLALGQAVLGGHARGPADIERAIEHLRAALTVFGRRSDAWAWTQTQQALGRAYMARVTGDRAETLRLAEECFVAALEASDRWGMADQWASLHAELANFELEFGGGSDGADAVEQGIAHLEAALEVHTAEGYPDQWADELTTLARAYRRRAAGSPVANLRQARQHVLAALRLFTREAWPNRWAEGQIELALIATELAVHDEPQQADEAVRRLTAALEVLTREEDPDGWARAHANLGAAHLQRRDNGEASEEALRCFAAAQEVFTAEADPERWLLTQTNLASLELARHGGDRGRLETVVAHCRDALRITAAPDDPWLNLSRMMADALALLGRWDEALEVYDALERAAERRRDAVATGTGRRALASRLAGVHPSAACCLLRTGQPGKAIVRLERGRTRALAEHRALGPAALAGLPRASAVQVADAQRQLTLLEAEERRPPTDSKRRADALLGPLLRRARADLAAALEAAGAPARADELPLAAILALAPAGGALAFPILTHAGSALVVLAAGQTDVTDEHVVWLDDFSSETAEALYVSGLGEAAPVAEPGFVTGRVAWQLEPTAERLASWEAIADAVTRRLWDGVAGPLVQRLTELGVEPEAEVCLIGGGAETALPLHAAWREHHGARRALIDDYLITYAPSALALATMREAYAARAPAATGLLAIVDPREDDERAAAEGRRVAALFTPDAVTILQGAAATQAAIVTGARTRTHVHFAGHAHFNYQEPMYTGLWIGDGNFFLVPEVIAELRLDSARLVSLSAPETALTDLLRDPDEQTGLSTAFAIAGAPGIVAASWEVGDTTSVMMERLYRFHLDDGVAPAAALREAQRWARANHSASVLDWAALRFIGC